MNRPLALGVAVLITGLVALPGCGSNSSGSKEAESRPSSAQSLVDGRQPLSVKLARQILCRADGSSSVDRIGYLEERVDPRVDLNDPYAEDPVVTFVYDKTWKRRLGFYLEDGATYSYPPGGGQRFLGNFEPNKRFEILFGVKGAYELAPLDNR